MRKIVDKTICQISKTNQRVFEMKSAICTSILAGALFGFYSLIPVFSVWAAVFFFLGIIILGVYLFVSNSILQDLLEKEATWSRKVQNDNYDKPLDEYIKTELTAEIAAQNSQQGDDPLTHGTKLTAEIAAHNSRKHIKGITKWQLVYFNYMFWVGIGCVAISGICLSISIFVKTPNTNSTNVLSDCIQLRIDSIQTNHQAKIDTLQVDIFINYPIPIDSLQNR